MTPIRQVLADLPLIALEARARLADENWHPTPDECAAAAHALALDRAERQPELPLERAA